MARFRTFSFNGVDERRFLAADKGSGTFSDLQVEVETGAENVLAQQAML